MRGPVKFGVHGDTETAKSKIIPGFSSLGLFGFVLQSCPDFSTLNRSSLQNGDFILPNGD
jgi:hypothetical protein